MRLAVVWSPGYTRSTVLRLEARRMLVVLTGWGQRPADVLADVGPVLEPFEAAAVAVAFDLDLPGGGLG